MKRVADGPGEENQANTISVRVFASPGAACGGRLPGGEKARHGVLLYNKVYFLLLIRKNQPLDIPVSPWDRQQ